MSDAPPALEDAQTTGPRTDWRATRSAWILGFLSQVLEYGRGLLADLRQRETDDAPPVIAYQFGAVSLSLIIARITRGIILATALQERVTRSARRLDAPLPTRKDTNSQTTPDDAESACAVHPDGPGHACATNPDEAGRAHTACPDDPEGASTESPEGASTDSPGPASACPQERPGRQPFDEEAELRNLPSAREIAARIRRKPIGEVLVEICRDLGIDARHPLWRDVFKLITFNGGNFTRLFRIVMNRSYAVHELGVPLPPLPPSAQSLLAILNGIGPPFDNPPPALATPPP